MRRSVSSSNIPLPWKNKPSMQRSKSPSTPFLMRRESAYGSSSRQPQSLQSLQLPKVSLFGRNSTTPSSRRSRVDDRQFHQEKLKQVTDYIQSKANLANQIDLSNFGKSMNRNVFILIISSLFDELGARSKITNDNFLELVPMLLKQLKYPGVINNSLLKTISVPNNFPVVINLFSWLISYSKVLNSEVLSFDNESSEEFKDCIDYINGCYKKFNNKDDGDEMLKEEFEQNLRGSQHLKKDFDINKLEQTERAQQAEIIDLTEKEKEYRLEINEIYSDLEKDNPNFEGQILKIEMDMNQLQSHNNEIEQRNSQLKQEIDELSQVVSKQSYTQIERSNLVQKLEELNRRFLNKQKMDDLLKSAKDDYDLKLSNLIETINNEVLKWNSSVLKATIDFAEAQSFVLRDGQFHKKDFLEEIMNVKRKVTEFKNKLSLEIGEMRRESGLIDKQLEDFNSSLSKNNDILVKLQAEKQCLLENISLTSAKCVEIEELQLKTKHERFNKKNQILEELCFRSEIEQISALSNEIAKLNMEINDCVSIGVESFSDKCLKFENNLKDLLEDKANFVKDVQIRTEGMKKEQEDILVLLKKQQGKWQGENSI